jgi:hypothetical protein
MVSSEKPAAEPVHHRGQIDEATRHGDISDVHGPDLVGPRDGESAQQGVPLRDGKDAMSVNWLGVSILDAKGKTTYDGAFVTSLPVTADKVVETAACARARWKIENESFNMLKNNGYSLAHNFGHGKKYLAGTFAAMNLLASPSTPHATAWKHAGKKPARPLGTLTLLPGHPRHLRPRRIQLPAQPHDYARLR